MTASGFGLHLSFKALPAVSKGVAACVHALLLQLANEPSTPSASLISFYSCFAKIKLSGIKYWHISSYLDKKTIRMQLNLFYDALNWWCIFICNNGGQKKSLQASKLEASPEIHQYLCPCILHIAPSKNRFGAIFWVHTKRLKFGNGSQYREYYWGGFSSCFLDCIKLDIGHGAVFSRGLKHIYAQPFMILLEWRNVNLL